VNYTVPISWTYYLPSGITPGTHTFTVFVLNATAGTLTLQAATAHFLYVTEQKR
jgi:hypothetical protein